MEEIDRKILIGLLRSHRSIYALEESLESTNYAPVHRHIKKLKEKKLLSTVRRPRKDGKLDKRKAEVPELTAKGMATLLIEGDLEAEELKRVMIKTLQKDYRGLPPDFLGVTNVDKIFADTLLRLRYKVNLKYFDDNYFSEVFNVSLGESIYESYKGFRPPKNTLSEKKARRLKKKYVLDQTIEDLRNLQKTFKNESNKYAHYSKAIGAIIQSTNRLK